MPGRKVSHTLRAQKMAECIFCKVARHELESKTVYEDDDLVAFHDINKKAPVHVLVIPKRHIESLLDLSEADDELIGRINRRLGDLARELGVDDSGFRVVVNSGPQAGQSVPHLHFHLLGGRLLGWPPG